MKRRLLICVLSALGWGSVGSAQFTPVIPGPVTLRPSVSQCQSASWRSRALPSQVSQCADVLAAELRRTCEVTDGSELVDCGGEARGAVGSAVLLEVTDVGDPRLLVGQVAPDSSASFDADGVRGETCDEYAYHRYRDYVEFQKATRDAESPWDAFDRAFGPTSDRAAIGSRAASSPNTAGAIIRAESDSGLGR